MAAAEGLLAEFSGFANLEEKKRKSNLSMSFPKIVNPMGSFALGFSIFSDLRS